MWKEWCELIIDIHKCSKCGISKTKKKYVVGSDNFTEKPVVIPYALFIGESPGNTEDIKGLPFQGSAGHILMNEIKRIGLHKYEYYICNTIKCRPIYDGIIRITNRKPSDGEIFNCSFFLVRQYNLLKPKIVVLLGKVAEDAWRVINDKSVVLLKFYHPAFLLYKEEMKGEFSLQFDKLKSEVLRIRNLI